MVHSQRRCCMGPWVPAAHWSRIAVQVAALRPAAHPPLPPCLAPCPHHRTVPTQQQQRLISEQLRRQQQGQPLAVLGAQRTQIAEVDVGPVVVQVLGADLGRKPSQSAQDFLRQRLGGVKRSADMLKPARALQPAHIAQRQAAHLAAQRRARPAAAAPAAGKAPQPKRRR